MSETIRSTSLNLTDLFQESRRRNGEAVNPQGYKLTPDQILGVYGILTDPAIQAFAPKFRIILPGESMENISQEVNKLGEPTEQTLAAGLDLLKNFPGNKKEYFVSNNPTVTRPLIPFVYLEQAKMDSFLEGYAQYAQ
ncbi:MAG TPA: hypothetical protein VG917_01245 [Patescibacteria group bacterium]|nr:hypothetical protein [Patescibacteria group bacterium]